MRERARRRERQRRPRTITGREANRQAATGCSLLAACCSFIAANLMLKPLRAPHSSLLPGLLKPLGSPGLLKQLRAAHCTQLAPASAYGPLIRYPRPVGSREPLPSAGPRRVSTRLHRGRAARVPSLHGRITGAGVACLHGCMTGARPESTRLHRGRASRAPPAWAVGHPSCGTPRAVGHHEHRVGHHELWDTWVVGHHELEGEERQADFVVLPRAASETGVPLVGGQEIHHSPEHACCRKALVVLKRRS